MNPSQAELEFRAWRRGQRRRRTLLGAASALALVVLVGVIEGRRRVAARRQEPSLPSVAEIEAAWSIWASAPLPGVLRGRPLTEVRLAADASGGRWPIRLYLDRDERPVGLLAVYRDAPEGLGDGVGDWLYAHQWEVDLREALAVEWILAKHLGCRMADVPRECTKSDADAQYYRGSTTRGRYRIEVTEDRDSQPDPRRRRATRWMVVVTSW